MTADRDAVAARAYALYVRGGRRPGRATEDWLEAERQLRAEAVTERGAVVNEPVRTLVPGAPLPAGRPLAVAPPPSAPAVPAVLAEVAVPSMAPKMPPKGPSQVASKSVPEPKKPSGGDFKPPTSSKPRGKRKHKR